MPAQLPVLETQSPADLVRFHLSLNVDDLAASIEFFTVLFDAPPAKRLHDYAKFELTEPPLVLSLEPNRAARGGKLNHLGFRLAGSEPLVAMQRRLELAGIRTAREDGVECCYARQTKFWVSDPDGNLWEMYTFEEDIEHRGSGKLPKQLAADAVARSGAAPAIWAHRLGEPLPGRILADDESTDEVVLQGTLNARLSPDAKREALTEVLRILKPGGKLSLHQLTAATPLATLKAPLPGPASIVECVPSAEETAADLAAAGFVDVHFVTLGDGACFHAEGVACRETRLVAAKPPEAASAAQRQVLYKGPFRQIVDDAGRTFDRGRWTTVDEAAWIRLQSSPLKEQFALGEIP
jgi:catechol 2,3-dioxygenase-like lactoylglutathione lyase family enzyme